MDFRIRPIAEGDVEQIVDLSLLAWEPVFASFEQVLGSTIYRMIWPEWRTSQRQAIETICRQDNPAVVLIAEDEGAVIGFIAYELNHKDRSGEVQLLAVHPAYQNRRVGTELNAAVLHQMKAEGMQMAKVETGGDVSHAAARKCYENAGYTALPIVRYFKNL